MRLFKAEAERERQSGRMWVGDQVRVERMPNSEFGMQSTRSLDTAGMTKCYAKKNPENILKRVKLLLEYYVWEKTERIIIFKAFLWHDPKKAEYIMISPNLLLRKAC